MLDEFFSSVIIAARKLSLCYRRLNNGQLTCPITLDPSVQSGWAQAPRPSGCIKAASLLLDKPISVYDFPPLGTENPLAAFVNNYVDRSEIYVSSTQNYCWRRFLVAKELAHLLICDSSNRTPIAPGEIASLLSDLINNVCPGDNRILQAESYAYFAAIEILLPQEHAVDAAAMLTRGSSVLELAQKYRIPRKAMELRLTDAQAVDLFNEIYESYSFQAVSFAPMAG